MSELHKNDESFGDKKPHNNKNGLEVIDMLNSILELATESKRKITTLNDKITDIERLLEKNTQQIKCFGNEIKHKELPKKENENNKCLVCNDFKLYKDELENCKKQIKNLQEIIALKDEQMQDLHDELNEEENLKLCEELEQLKDENNKLKGQLRQYQDESSSGSDMSEEGDSAANEDENYVSE